MKHPLAYPIELYRRWVSPLLPPHCRFHPSCSAYALEALAVHGTLRGGAYALGRVCRCHPLCEGGLDPVPRASGDAAGVTDASEANR